MGKDVVSAIYYKGVSEDGSVDVSRGSIAVICKEIVTWQRQMIADELYIGENPTEKSKRVKVWYKNALCHINVETVHRRGYTDETETTIKIVSNHIQDASYSVEELSDIDKIGSMIQDTLLEHYVLHCERWSSSEI